MYFANQRDYEQFHSPEQRSVRTAQAKHITEQAVSDALTLFNAGDTAGARQRLFNAGIQDDGIATYIQMWCE